MRFEMGFVSKIALAIAMAFSAGSLWAADVAPFVFEGIAEDDQQEYWDYLMKYKIFGQNGIKFNGQQIFVPDESGWFGTADGDFDASSGNEKHRIGGPILIAGDMKFADGNDTLSSGPVRVLGNITVANFNAPNLLDVVHCVQGTVDEKYIQNSDLSASNRYFGANYGDCPENVPEIKRDLSIPKDGSTGNTYHASISIDNSTRYIDVPPVQEGEAFNTPYDFYVESISFDNNSLLIIRMPANGRLTRVFVRDGFWISAHPKIRIQYMDGEDASYQGGAWTGSGTFIENRDYSGNLLFYTQNDISWPAITAEDSIQGTFISGGTISVQQHMTLAGQLLAKNISINANFDGTGFRFVPFDPPILDLRTADASSGRNFPENNTPTEVPVSLDGPADVDVSFRYCVQYLSGDVAANEDDFVDPLPECIMGSDNKPVSSETYGRAFIPMGATAAINSSNKIFVNAKKDGIIEEAKERFRLWICDIQGAVLSGNVRESFFTMYVVDMDQAPTSKDSTLLAAEDTEYTIPKGLFHYESESDLEELGTLITKIPTRGILVLGGDTIKELPANGLLISVSDIEAGLLKYIPNKDLYSDSSETGLKVFEEIEFKAVGGSQDNPYYSDETYKMSVYVSPVNDAPVVDNPVVSFKENSEAGTAGSATISVKDVDDETFTYAFKTDDANFEKVNSLYEINETTGVISVKEGAALNYESADSVLTIAVVVTDNAKTTGGVGKSSVESKVTLKLEDENEKPSLADAVLTVEENSAAGTEVGQIAATDEDLWTVFTYTLVDSTKGAADLFSIDEKGVITVAKDNSLDYEKDSLYYVKVIVHDNGKSAGFGTDLYDTAVVTIKVTDVNESPSFVDASDHYNVFETTKEDPIPNGFIFGKIQVNDPENAGEESFVPSLVDLNKVTGVSAEDLFNVIVKQDSESKKNYLYLVVKDGDKLDYEALYEKHYDGKSGKVSFDVRIIVADNDGGKDSVETKIWIDDRNEAPSIDDFTTSIEENLEKGSVAGTMTASDIDIYNPLFSHLEYRVIEDDVPFVMDSSNVVVSDPSKLDFETVQKFTFSVEVKNCEINESGVKSASCLADTASVTITLTDVNENPRIIEEKECEEGDEDCSKCDASIADCNKPSDPPPAECVENCGYKVKDTVYVNVRENSKTGTKVLEYYVDDQDAGDLPKVTASLRDENNSGSDSLFEAKMEKEGDRYKVVVFVKDSSKLDYETIKPSHKVSVIVEDEDGLRDSVVRVINIVDVNEPPFVVHKEFDFDEHNETGSAVGKIEWGDDKDTKQPAFRDNKVVLNGGDVELFDVSSDGVITAKKSFNYESDDSTYVLYIKVVDKNEPDLFVLDTMTIHLKNIPEAPVITSTEFTTPENPEDKTVIGVITSEDLDDPENQEERTYTMVGTSEYVDVTKDGKIVVKNSSKIDFETVETINIKVKVTDPQGVSSDTTIVVKVTDVNEPPVVKDQTIRVSEDTKPKTVIDTVEATDPDKTPEFSELTYKVISGDTTKFSIDPKTGAITLKDSLDFEEKSKYEFVVEVSDGEYKDSAKITVDVTNVIENSKVVIETVEDGDSLWTKPDSVFTNRPSVTVCWSEDGRNVCQDTTLTEGIHTIIKRFKDPRKDVEGADTVVIQISTVAPKVTVTANADDQDESNIYTIEESLGAGDSSIYVNKTKNDIRVTVKDPVTKKDSSFVVKLDLETVNVSKSELSSVSSVAESGNLTLNLNPTSGVSRTSVNGDEVKVSYTEEVNGKKLQVSYRTDNDGEILKTPVLDAQGNVDSIEVITISYVTIIGGKEVTVSYQADAITGKVLNVGSDGTLTYADKIVISGSSSSSGTNSGDNKTDSSSSSGNSQNATSKTEINVGTYKVTYEYIDEKGNTVEVTYTIGESGNIVKNGTGDIGYSVSYSYTNKFGNSATQSVFIVLDQVAPKVEILYPSNMQVVRANYVEVRWTVDGVEQDTLTLQGLEKGFNKIMRYYRDKAGNVTYDSVVVMMKDGKDVELAVEQPVVQMDPAVVEEYYAINPPEEGERIAVSIKNPSTGKEVETLIGGTFGTKGGSGDTPYPGVSGDTHLGPTIAMDVKLPVVNDIGGLATLDDLVGSDGLVSLDGVDAKNSNKVSVEEYVSTYCKEDFKIGSDMSRVNLYKTRMDTKVWIYTTLGNYVDFYSFKQELNDPDYTNEAGALQMYFELKPDRNGEVLTEDGHVLATGAYLYKVEAKIRAELQCTLPPVKDTSTSAKKKGDVIKKSDEMLKSFGYKRPQQK